VPPRLLYLLAIALVAAWFVLCTAIALSDPCSRVSVKMRDLHIAHIDNTATQLHHALRELDASPTLEFALFERITLHLADVSEERRQLRCRNFECL
jgi:hypothetical protein